MSSPLLQLHSDTRSLIIKLHPAPEVLHWGKRISRFTSSHSLCITQARALMQARLDIDVPVTLCPELGRGSFGSPGILGHREGEDWAPQFLYHSHWVEGGKAEVVCLDEAAQLELTICLALSNTSGVLTKKLRLVNKANACYQVDKLALTIPLPYRAKELESYSGRWSREFQSQRQTLEHGFFSQENRRGRTSHEYFPGCLVGGTGFSDEQGEVWAFHLGCSSNHFWRAEAKSDGRRFVQFGELLMPGEVSLEAGESYTTPTLYCSYSPSGINGIRKANHGFVRGYLLKFESNKSRPVHLNTWEGIYFEHDPDYICEMATRASKMGIERFVVDDGWFKGRDNDSSALGDWTLDKRKYPNGLYPVIKHVNRLGMEFGLWVEPEMISEDSDLYRTHPEWVLADTRYPLVTGRNQLVLNLQIKECFDYVYTCLDHLLASNNIAYLKWDMNRELNQPSHLRICAVHKQTKAVYRLLDMLRGKHPSVEIESCSSGGGRMDYEILKRTQRFWVSDCNDALERQTIQKKVSIFFPLEVMGSHIGPQHSHTTRRQHNINLRGITALFGHMGVELDPVRESESECAGFAKYIEMHKRFRSLLHTGNSLYLDSCEPSREAYGVFDHDQLLLAVCQKQMPDYALPEPLVLSMLDVKADYWIELVDYPQQSLALMKQLPTWMSILIKGDKLKVSGAELAVLGLSLPIQDPETCLLLYLVRD